VEFNSDVQTPRSSGGAASGAIVVVGSRLVGTIEASVVVTEGVVVSLGPVVVDTPFAHAVSDSKIDVTPKARNRRGLIADVYTSNDIAKGLPNDLARTTQGAHASTSSPSDSTVFSAGIARITDTSSTDSSRSIPSMSSSRDDPVTTVSSAVTPLRSNTS